MQKFLKAAAIATVMALVATAAFAQITVGGWGRIDFVALSSSGAEGADLITNMGPGWGGKGRVGVKIDGNSDNIGFSSHFNTDPTNGNLGFGDHAKVYLRFNDMFMLTYGRAEDQTLRGKLGGYTLIDSRDEDALFRRIYPGAGVILAVTPVDGFYFGASVDMADKTVTEDVFRAIQVGAGYTIDGIGFVRAQYIGEGFSQVNGGSPQCMEVAFQITAVDGLNADIGATIALAENTAHTVDLAASYKLDSLDFLFRTAMALGGGADFALSQVTLSGSYALDFASIGLEVGAYNLLVEDGMSLQFAPYIRKGYGNGYFRAGMKGTLPLAENANFAWEIPLRIEYWF